ncbi:Uncharacterised protein [uncultured archaeon]|nr:Uncharacterised protein [uncultured archaeon]
MDTKLPVRVEVNTKIIDILFTLVYQKGRRLVLKMIKVPNSDAPQNLKDPRKVVRIDGVPIDPAKR